MTIGTSYNIKMLHSSQPLIPLFAKMTGHKSNVKGITIQWCMCPPCEFTAALLILAMEPIGARITPWGILVHSSCNAGASYGSICGCHCLTCNSNSSHTVLMGSHPVIWNAKGGHRCSCSAGNRW